MLFIKFFGYAWATPGLRIPTHMQQFSTLWFCGNRGVGKFRRPHTMFEIALSATIPLRLLLRVSPPCSL